MLLDGTLVIGVSFGLADYKLSSIWFVKPLVVTGLVVFGASIFALTIGVFALYGSDHIL
jgi:hypothetical protein